MIRLCYSTFSPPRLYLAHFHQVLPTFPTPPDLAAQRAGHTGLLSSGNRTFHDVHVLGALSLVVFVFGELLYTFFSELGMNVAEPHR